MKGRGDRVGDGRYARGAQGGRDRIGDARHGYDGYRDIYRHSYYRWRYPYWSVGIGYGGYGIWGGYRDWGVYLGSLWPYGGYYDYGYGYGYSSGAYYNSAYYNPIRYAPLSYGAIAYAPVTYGAIAYDPIVYESINYSGVTIDASAAAAAPQGEEVPPPEPTDQARRTGDQYIMDAEDAFRSGRYKDSVTNIDHALVEQPDDGYAMLLLSQSLFAVGDYEAATAVAYRGMSQLDQKDWGFVVENYAKYYGNNDYVTQMRKLDQYIKDHPDAAYARALRGYHFGFLGYDKQARDDLGKAVELESRDQFAAQLLTRFGGTPPKPKPMIGPPLPPPRLPPRATMDKK